MIIPHFVQDIFETIKKFRGDNGAVKLKDLVQFLRAVCENIEQNFKVCPTKPKKKNLLSFSFSLALVVFYSHQHFGNTSGLL